MTSVPFPKSLDELRNSLRETELDEAVRSTLAGQAKPAILLTTESCDEDALALGASKIGGRPELPSGMPWPVRPAYPDADKRAAAHRKDADRLLADSRKPRSWMTPEQGDRFAQEARDKADAIESEFPLAFFGQVDLAELSTLEGFDPELPDHGRLLVFYDVWEQPEDFTPEASVGWQVLWDTTPSSQLVRAPVPPELAAISGDGWSCVFRPARVSAKTVFTPIPLSDRSWNAFPLDDDDAVEIYQEWLAEFGTPDMKGRDNHQLGGFPQPLQNGLQSTSQLVSNGINCGGHEVWQTDEAKELLKSAGDWRLVLQIGVDTDAGMRGPGAYYVIMREEC